jgi:hypothetical protein
LPLPFSSPSQIVQPLNKGFIKNLVAVASSNLHVSFDDSAIRQVRPSAPPGRRGGGGQKPRHQAGRSGAAMASMMMANASCERMSRAFLAILEPERKGLADSGVRQVSRG